MYHDGYKEIIEAMITSKMKGEVAQVKEKMPKRPGSQEHDIRAKLFYEEYQCNLR